MKEYDAAYVLIREGGWANVSARATLKEFQSRAWTDDVLLNLAFGSIAFARDERQLFGFLCIDRPEVIGSIGHYPDEKVLRLLQNAGHAFYLWAMDRRPQSCPRQTRGREKEKGDGA